ncbi:MAG: DNA repair protein RecO [Ignavibacterium sp.]
MSEIIKTESIVLSKIDYSNSSKIVSLFTYDYGKMSAIIKGGRGKNSKVGLIVDTLNVINLVIYKKDTREIQIISSADLINYFNNIHSDFEKLKYSLAVIELLKKLLNENDVHHRLFRGTKRILEIINSSNEHPSISFTKYFLFFLQEIGYEIQLDYCSICHNKIAEESNLGFIYDKGIVCSGCSQKYVISMELSTELYKMFMCLKFNKNNLTYNSELIKKMIKLLENFLKFHIENFKGLDSLNL